MIFEDVVRQVITTYGSSIVKESRFYNIILDMQGFKESPSYKFIVKNLIAEGVLLDFYNEGAWNAKTLSIADIFSANTGIQKDQILSILKIIANALSWDDSQSRGISQNVSSTPANNEEPISAYDGPIPTWPKESFASLLKKLPEFKYTPNECSKLLDIIERAIQGEAIWQNFIPNNMAQIGDYLRGNYDLSQGHKYYMSLWKVFSSYCPDNWERFIYIPAASVFKGSLYFSDQDIKKLGKYYDSIKLSTNENLIRPRCQVVRYMSALVTGRPWNECLESEYWYSNNDSSISYTSKTSGLPVKLPRHKLIQRPSWGKYPFDILGNISEDILHQLCKESHIDDPVEISTKYGKYEYKKWQVMPVNCEPQSFATNLFLYGATLRQISEWMGLSFPDKVKQFLLVPEEDFAKLNDNPNNFFNY